MLKPLVLLVLCISCCWCSEFEKSKIPQCHAGDAPCMIKITNIILSQYYGGEPIVHLPRIDPLEINQMSIKEGGKHPGNMDINFNNVRLNGLSKFVLTSITGFGSNPIGQYEVKLKGPQLILEGPYTMEGKVLTSPIQGHCNVTIDNPEIHVKFNGKTKQENGKVLLYTDDLRLTAKLTKIQTQFGHLLNGEKEISDKMNKYFNDNWQDFFNELEEPIFDAFSLITQSMFNDMFPHLDYNEIFLKD